MAKIEADLPIGVGVHLVADQPAMVEDAVCGFTKALFEAVAIVLVVSFLSLGVRAVWSWRCRSRSCSRSPSS